MHLPSGDERRPSTLGPLQSFLIEPFEFVNELLAPFVKALAMGGGNVCLSA